MDIMKKIFYPLGKYIAKLGLKIARSNRRRRFSRSGIGFFLFSITFLLNPPLSLAQVNYSLQVVAKLGAPIQDPDSASGDLGTVDALASGPSINDSGKVAFVAASGSDVRLMVDNFGVIEKNLKLFPPGQLIANIVQINNHDHVSFNYLDNRAGPTFQDTTLVRLDDPDGTNPVIARGSFFFTTPYDIVYAAATLNNNDAVVFSAELKTGGTVMGFDDDPDSPKPDAQSGLVGTPDLIPSLSDTGRTVFRRGSAGNFELLMFPDLSFSSAFIFADNSQYLQIGRRPAISDDGRMIVFSAQHSTLGYGLYAAAVNPTNQFILFQVLSIPSNVDLDRRVGINHVKGGTAFDYRIAYLSKNAAGAVTVNTIDVDVANPNVPVYTNATTVLTAGGTISGVSGTTQDFLFYDPINNYGQLVFFVQTTTNRAIIRAGEGLTQPPIQDPTCEGDPVYMHSGQYYYQCPDLTIPGKGMNLVINHHYTGQTAKASAFGFGWSISYYARLTVLNNGSVEISDGSRRKDVYALNGSTYSAPAGFYQTLVKNTDGTWVITERDGTQKIFDVQGKLTRIQDRNGNAIVLTYDPNGKLPIIGPNPAGGTSRQVIGSDYRLTKITGTNAREMTFTYNADGLLSTMTDVTTDRKVTFTYDAVTNDLLKITKPSTAQFTAGVTEVFTYDGRHNLLTMQDGKNQTFVTNVYDTQNRVIKQTLGSGFYTFVYGVNKTTVTDRKGFVRIYDFNAGGKVLKLTQQTKALRPTDPAAFVTSHTYNTINEELASTVFPKGNGIFYKYDIANADPRARGNLLEARRKSVATAPDNDTTDIVVKYTYETRFNQLKTMTDAKAKVTTYTYDYELSTADPRYGESGNLVKVEQPLLGTVRPTTLFSYNANGQPVEIIDPNGNITRMAYFPDTGFLQSIARDPLGINALTQFAYDNFGNVSRITDPNAKVTSFEYNELGWLLSTTNALTRKVRYTHDANGNILKEERQSNTAATAWQTIQYTYDLLNHLKTVRDPLNRLTTFNYDLNENPLNRVDALNNTTAYVYDERDLLFKVTDANTPSAGVTQYDYDSNGLLKALTDAKGNKTTYTYDGFDRLTRTTYPDAKFEQYFYDKNSNMTRKITPNNETINYTYDALNRLVTQTYADTTMNVTYSYDLGSRLTRVRNSFSDVTYLYNKLNFLIRETHKFGTLTFAVNSAYDKAGNRTKVTYPSGKVVNYVYNAVNQPTQVKVNGVALANYSYDVLNRLTWKDLLGGTTKRAAHTYDLANQLKVLENTLVPAGTLLNKHTYTYDLAGNRLSHANQTAATATMNFAYNKIYELTTVSNAQTHSYAHDKVGNRTTADGVAYVSNNLNQYTTVGGAALTYNFNGNLTQEPGASYAYDAENRLLTVTKGTTVANYRYDAFNRRISKDISGVKKFYIHDGNEVVEERDASGALAADYVLGPRTDEILTMTRGGQTYYYFYDGLGSVRQLTDAAGAVIESYDYDVYGQPLTLSAVGNPAMFTGRWFDSESGLYYYRARYYSPTLGRFLQRDPIGYRGGMNLYTYVKNNSINFIDPLGLDTHHFIPQAIWRNLNLTPEVRTILKNETIEAGKHFFTTTHYQYNALIKGLWDEVFIGIKPEEITESMIKEFIERTKTNPVVADLLKKILKEGSERCALKTIGKQGKKIIPILGPIFIGLDALDQAFGNPGNLW